MMIPDFSPLRMSVFRISYLTLALLVGACVDPEETILHGTVDVIVVDGTITNLAEPQIIHLSRSRADPVTGRFGVLPITKAVVEVVIDSAQVVACHEIMDGVYQLFSDFKAQVGHAYQLRFRLSNGTQYVSNQQVMPIVPAIDNLLVRFSTTSLPVGLYSDGFRAGYDVSLSTKDPVNQRNYYRWDWNLYEKQKWCHTCYQGVYSDTVQEGYIQNGTYVFTRRPVEDCVEPAVKPNGDFWFSYTCRTQCWDILHNYTLNLFDDQLTNGGEINGRRVAQVPLFTRQPALLEIRQASMTADAYRYFRLFQQQTQNTGGLADTPPTALVGNVANQGNLRELVIGFFTASAISTRRHWLDKKDATIPSMGAYDDNRTIVQGDDELYFVQNKRVPTPGPEGPPFMGGGPSRYITAPCVPSDSRTPYKPAGWPD